MRRAFFLLLGAVELAIALGVVLFARRLPEAEAVRDRFHDFGRVSRGAQGEVSSLRGQVSDLRRPELRRTAERARRLAELAQAQRVDFETVAAIDQSLGRVAEGLEAWSGTLDDERMRSLSDSLGLTADFLDADVVPGAKQAAEGVAGSTAALAAEAERLGALLRKAPVDLTAMRQVYDSLGAFGGSVEKVTPALRLDRLGTIRDGLAGMESALTQTAAQVEKLAGYSYPVVTMRGLRPSVEQKPFWPAGGDIAAGLRKAIKGLKAANAELETLDEQMPALRESLDQSRRVIGATRQAMASALEKEKEVGELMRDVPERTAAMAEQLPKVGRAYSAVLQGTDKLDEVAASLRKAKGGLDASLEQWPKLRASLKQSASVLTAARAQFAQVLAQREQYEAALNASLELAKLTPEFSEAFDERLAAQEAALGQLHDGLEEVNASLPAAERGANELIDTARWVLWLIAGMMGLHGFYVTMEAVSRPRSAPPAAGEVQTP